MADTRKVLGNAISQAMMALGQGMTGQPFLTGYLQNQQKNKEVEYENQLRQLQIQKIGQELDQRKLFQEWLMNQGQGNANGIPALGGQGSGLGMTGFSVGSDGMPTIQFGQTPESKIKEQAMIAQAKETETAIGKAERLQKVGESVKREWLKTSPYSGAITKTGLVPVLGMWDIVKKGVGATDAQQRDQAYASFVKGIRAQLARGMGDVGNLSETEQTAVSNLVPTLFDSYESGVKKLESIAALVNDIRNTRAKQGFSEFTVEGKNYRIPTDKVESFMKAKGLR